MIFEFGALATATFIPLVLWLVLETVAFLAQRQPAGGLDRLNRTLTRLGHAPLDALPPRL